MDIPEISGDTIKIPPDLKYLQVVDEFVEGFLTRANIDEALVPDIAISVSELVNNAVSHGGRTSPNKPVIIAVNKTNGEVVIAVTDQGAGFNPDEIEDPLADENLMKETGRGIFIVRSLMDSVDIKTTDHGTTVTIKKAV